MSQTDLKDSSTISSRSKTKSFDQCYRSYCKVKNVSPMRNLLKNSDYMLDFCVDKIKYSQWDPILVAIAEDISLECLSIRCRAPSKAILENVDSENKVKNISKSPVILTKFMLWKLVESISQCISQTPLLNILQLEGLPLPEPYVDLLAESLTANMTLKYVGLSGCQIGDSGCQKVCSVIRNMKSLIVLNLSGCNLTPKGMTYIADMINYIKIMRYSENWQHTLRYQSPDLDAMSGLRRITLSDNPNLGDSGLVTLFEVLLDDLWIKAVDLQYCGITDNILKDCVKFFENNSCLHLLDLRYNQQMSVKVYGTIISLAHKNECSSSKCASWFLLSNNPIFRNNQKVVPQKTVPLKEKTSKTQFRSVNSVKSEGGDADHFQIHLLKDQLKNEITMRKKLEELNNKLLQQVKELKANQIANWKAQLQSKNETSLVVNKLEERVVKQQREIITINLNQDIDDAETDTHRTETSSIAPSVDENKSLNHSQNSQEKVKHEINLRDSIGVNLLESFLQQKNERRSCNGYGDGYNSETSSESSASTLRRNGSTSSVILAPKFK